MFKKIINVVKNFNDKSLNLLIFFVTGKCNLSCNTCFYWDKLNKGNDLTFRQISDFIQHLPRFKQLIISGGEPFLRDDLSSIIKEFEDKCLVQEVDIPTNGLLTEQILRMTKEILTQNQDLRIVLSISWDGLEDVNNSIRAGTREFGNVLTTIRNLVLLSNSYRNLEVQVNTVICRDNYLTIGKFLKYMEGENYFGIKRHLFEIVRGDPKKKDESGFSPEEFPKLKNAFLEILAYQDKMFKNSVNIKNCFLKRIVAGFNYANLRTIYSIQYDFITKRKQWNFLCASAYGLTAVVEHDGDVKLCELRGKIGNIKDKNLPDLFDSKEAIEERKEIIEGECSCSHICFLYPSLYHDFRMVFFRLPLEYLKYLFGVKIW